MKQNFSKISKYLFCSSQFKRYFILKYNCVENIEYRIVNHRETHQNLLKNYEESGELLFSGELISTKNYIFLFSGKNESIPYNFMKKDPYYINNLIQDYLIEEIELRGRTDNKALSKLDIRDYT